MRKALKHSTPRAPLVVPNSVAICASELDDLATACLRLEPVIGDLLASKGASVRDILILQDLDRIQQHMVAIAQVLNATGSEDELFEITRNLPLDSLRAKLLSEFGTPPQEAGEFELF